jgi:hypothetical protein
MKILLVGLLLISSHLASATEPYPSPTDRFKVGDAAFRARKSDSQARESLKQFRDVYGDHPDDVDATWRLAMACYFVGLRVEKDSALKRELFAEGRDAAVFGTKREPNCAPCHFWAATNMVLYGQEVGVLKMLFSLKEVQAHLKSTMELEPKYMSSGAFRIQGMIDWKLPRLLGGSLVLAKENLQKAVTGSPEEPLNYLFLAKFFEEEEHDHLNAAATAKLGLAIKNIAWDHLESKEAQEELKAFVK